MGGQFVIQQMVENFKVWNHKAAAFQALVFKIIIEIIKVSFILIYYK